MSKETGGAASPEVLAIAPEGDIHAGNPGMTLRDYFAANAPITVEDAMLVAGLDCNAFGMLPLAKRLDVMIALADMRGSYADAMIAERAK